MLDTAAIRALADAATPGPSHDPRHGEWQRMDTAPKDGTQIQLNFLEPDWITANAYWNGEHWIDNNNEWIEEPYRWRPHTDTPGLESFHARCDANRELRTAVPQMCDELDALREQLDAAQTALVDAETVKRERDTLRDKIAKLRELAAEVPYNRLDYPKLRVDEVLAILDEVNNAAI